MNRREKSPRNRRATSLHSTTIVLSTVAACNVTSKSRFCSISTPMSALAICRCPLLDTGRNSVSPCTMPKIMASIVSIVYQRLRMA